MTVAYPQIDRWVIPAQVCAASATAVTPAGLAGRESGAFWLGDRAAVARVRAVVLPTGPGVEELPGRWRVSPEVFGVISRWAKPQGLSLLAVAHSHTHGVPVRLSWTDRRESVQAPGILAVVIGNGGEDRDPGEWGWYVFDDGDYRELTVLERSARLEIPPTPQVEVWRADAHGVRTAE